MVANMSDQDVWRLNRGGHDPAEGLRRLSPRQRAQGPADGAAGETVKGFGMGKSGQGKNTAHQTRS
jgi:pyruvate dehydrogenase E1 component